MCWSIYRFTRNSAGKYGVTESRQRTWQEIKFDILRLLDRLVPRLGSKPWETKKMKQMDKCWRLWEKARIEGVEEHLRMQRDPAARVQRSASWLFQSRFGMKNKQPKAMLSVLAIKGLTEKCGRHPWVRGQWGLCEDDRSRAGAPTLDIRTVRTSDSEQKVETGNAAG